MKKGILLTLLMLTISQLGYGLQFSRDPKIYTTKPNMPIIYKEVCLVGLECVIQAYAISAPNPTYKKYNKIVYYTTNPNFNLNRVNSFVRNDLGHGKAIQKVEFKLVSPTEYGAVLSNNNVPSSVIDLSQDLELAERDFKQASFGCGLSLFFCGVGTGLSLSTGNAVGLIASLGACTTATVTCSRLDTQYKRLKLLRKRLERESRNSRGNSGGGGGGANTPDPGAGGPISNPGPGRGRRGNVTITDCPGGICPHRP